MRHGYERRHIQHLLTAGTAPIACQTIDAKGISGNGSLDTRGVSARAGEKQIALTEIGTFFERPRGKLGFRLIVLVAVDVVQPARYGVLARVGDHHVAPVDIIFEIPPGR